MANAQGGSGHAVGERSTGEGAIGPSPTGDATSIFGLRSSIRASHDPSGAPLRAARLATATAPMISNLRMSR